MGRFVGENGVAFPGTPVAPSSSNPMKGHHGAPNDAKRRRHRAPARSLEASASAGRGGRGKRSEPVGGVPHLPAHETSLERERRLGRNRELIASDALRQVRAFFASKSSHLAVNEAINMRAVSRRARTPAAFAGSAPRA